jgi:hypothetical protein
MASSAKMVAEIEGKYSAGAAFGHAQRDMAKTAKQGKALNNQFRIMRGGVGQMGHQVQDIAVQLQGGQNPFLILGQQGSQIASLMGPHGAVVGAFLAVGAAIASSMLPNLFGATEAMQDLNKEGEKLVDRFHSLEGALKLEAIRMVNQDIGNLEEVIADAKEEIYELGTAERAAALGAHVMQSTIDKANEKIKDQNKTILLAEERITKLKGSIDGTSDATESLVKSLEAEAAALGKTQRELDILKATNEGATQADLDAINAAHDKKDAYDDVIEGIKEEQDALKAAAKAKEKKTAAEIKMEEDLAAAILRANEKKEASEQAARDKANARAASDMKNAITNLDALEVSLMNRAELLKNSYEQEQAVLDEALAFNLVSRQEHAALQHEIDVKMAESQKELALSTASNLIGMTSSMVSTMSGMVEEGSAMGKAFFVINQALAAANAIVMGYQTASAVRLAYATMAAMSGPAAPAVLAAGEAHATIAMGMGFATAGMIAGQTLASFEGGGFTGSGVRSGGMDGKGGMMAMLHPNEKVTDLHKGQGESQVINVNFTIQANDTKGFDELLNSRRGQIVSMINRAANNRGRASIA